jgi:hypothetical protein
MTRGTAQDEGSTMRPRSHAPRQTDDPEVLYWPASHNEQADAAAALYCPLLHTVHTVDLAALNHPAGQSICKGRNPQLLTLAQVHRETTGAARHEPRATPCA